MNDKKLSFTSKKYTKEELKSFGVIAFKNITCRKIDVQNPYFINYHLHDLISYVPERKDDNPAYIVEMNDHKSNDKLGIIEILLFSDTNQRDRFSLLNADNFKTTKNNEIIYEELLLTYLN